MVSQVWRLLRRRLYARGFGRLTSDSVFHRGVLRIADEAHESQYTRDENDLATSHSCAGHCVRGSLRGEKEA